MPSVYERRPKSQKAPFYDVNVTYGKLRFLAYLSSFVDKYRRNQPGSQGLLFNFLTHNTKTRPYLVFKKILWISSLVNGAQVQKATRFYYFPITSRTNKGNFSHFRGAICRKTNLVTMFFLLHESIDINIFSKISKNKKILWISNFMVLYLKRFRFYYYLT